MSRRDTFNPVAKEVPFDNTNKKYRSENVENAIEEIRDNTVFAVDDLVSSLNGNHNISIDDSNIHDITGTAIGYSVTLPDATQLFLGRRFEITNSSSETVQIKDNSGFVLSNLISSDTIILTLSQNLTAAGEWLSVTVTSSATGIISYVISDQTIYTTTSPTDTLVIGQTITPVAGRYAVFQSSEFTITQNNRIAEGVVYVDGVADEDSRRVVQGVGSNYRSGFNTLTEASVNGLQAVDFRVNITAGSLNVTGRTLLLIRLGGQ